jgi:hypothetical protein
MTILAYLVLGITLLITAFIVFRKDKTQHEFIAMTVLLILNSYLGGILALKQILGGP